MAWVLGCAYASIMSWLAESYYNISAERWLFGSDNDLAFFLGVCSVLLSPLLVLLAAASKRRVLVVASVGVLVLALVWVARLIYALCLL